jgi:uncharacterized membrane protein YphA (DoxX/SURF4 family)
MLAGIFVVSGAQALANPDSLAPRARRVTDRVAPTLTKINERVPTDARTLVRVNAAVQLAAGLALLSRLRRPAAMALAGTLVPATLAGHPFWEDRDMVQRRQQQTHFLKNIGLFGGLLLAASDTEGRPGLRWRARRAAHDANRAIRRSTKRMSR